MIPEDKHKRAQLFERWIKELNADPAYIERIADDLADQWTFNRLIDYIDRIISEERREANITAELNPGMKYGVDFTQPRLDDFAKAAVILFKWCNKDIDKDIVRLRAIRNGAAAEPENSTSKEKKSRLSLPQIALIEIYNKRDLTSPRNKLLAAKHGYIKHRSGDTLQAKYNVLLKTENRLFPYGKNDDEKRVRKTRIKLIKSVLPYLEGEPLKWAEADICKIERSF